MKTNREMNVALFHSCRFVSFEVIKNFRTFILNADAIHYLLTKKSAYEMIIHRAAVI